MPVILVKLFEEVFTPVQKNEIIAKLTDAMAGVKCENKPPVTWVIIEDAVAIYGMSVAAWSMGGAALSSPNPHRLIPHETHICF